MSGHRSSQEANKTKTPQGHSPISVVSAVPTQCHTDIFRVHFLHFWRWGPYQQPPGNVAVWPRISCKSCEINNFLYSSLWPSQCLGPRASCEQLATPWPCHLESYWKVCFLNSRTMQSQQPNLQQYWERVGMSRAGNRCTAGTQHWKLLGLSPGSQGLLSQWYRD
jgi:hypothetical protein